MNTLRVAAFDPSLRNWGMAKGTLCLSTLVPTIDRVSVTNPVLPTGKQVRQNSKDIAAAYQLTKAAWDFVQDAQAIFVEVPVGSQSSRAMASYGICVGILGALRAGSIPFYEVTPTEVKLAAVGSKTATKKQMIDWALQQQPNANWPYYTRDGQNIISETKAEHMADAIAAIYAGITLPSFQQAVAIMKAA